MKPFRGLISKLSRRKAAGASTSQKKRASKDRSYRYVFIFTYGRSGSTLLLGYLNTLPGFCIRGENYNALFHLCNFYRSIKRTTGEVGKKSMQPVHPWFGVDLIELEAVREAVRRTFTDTVLNPPEDAKVVGFKEIRIDWNWIPDFDAFMVDLMEIFGDVKIIFNHRDLKATSRSRWWKDTAHSYATIRGMDQRLRGNCVATLPNVFHVEYEDLIAGPDHARKLAEFLDMPFNLEAYRQVMGIPHSY